MGATLTSLQSAQTTVYELTPALLMAPKAAQFPNLGLDPKTTTPVNEHYVVKREEFHPLPPNGHYEC